MAGFRSYTCGEVFRPRVCVWRNEKYYANLGIENKNHLLSGFKVRDDIVLKEYTTKVKEQATAKGRSLRNMAMNVCNSIRALYTLKGHAKAFFFVCLCFVIVVVLGYTWFCWYPILKVTV